MKGEGHRSGGSRCSKILTKKAEGELAHRIHKVVKHGFPIMGKKVWQTAFKHARENNIKGFSTKKAAAGYKWLHGFIGRNERLAVKKATQISWNRAGALTQQSVFN